MKLLSLNLNNFQGIKLEEMIFDGRSANIFGDNETGKTTVANAYFWLLFDKAITGVKNFTPKTRVGDDDAHYLEHSVEGQFRTEEGRIITFKKVFHEIYKTKRGTGVETFDGHTTDYFVDGVPKSQKEYELEVSHLIKSFEIAKMLTSPHFFSLDTPWADRRKLLFDICGDYTDQEIMAGNKELHDLIQFLVVPGTTDQFRTVDDYKRIASEREKLLNAEIKKIPTRIDEATKAIPSITRTVEDINSSITELRDKQHSIEIEMMQASDGSSKHTKIRTELAELKAKFSEEKAKFDEKQRSIISDLNLKIDGFKAQLRAESDERSKLRSEIDQDERSVERMNNQRAQLVTRYKELEARVWDPSKETCPTCNQSLPTDKVDELKANFNLSKSQELESINAIGNKECSSNMISDLKLAIEHRRMALNNIETAISGFEKAIKELEAQKEEIPKFETTDLCKDILAGIKSCETRLQFADSESEDLKTPLKRQISELETEIESLKSEKLKFETKSNQEARIKDLETELKKYSSEYEQIQKGLYLCEQFTRIKAKMLDERINSRFKSVKFRLFVDQINGGLKDDCEVLVPSKEGNLVPYPMANSAGQINAGLEIIGVLSEHFGIKLPIFVDNAESVTKLNEIDTQIIRLIVSEDHKKLTMEVI